MDNKKALVLSGGSIKGAFQAGAIAALLESGFVPDAIYGTSVGSLNGAFLAERAGRQYLKDKHVDWPDIGQQLEQFWREELKSPAQVGSQRKVSSLITALLRQKFQGLIDTGPLRTMVETQFDEENLRASPVMYYACAVNLASGEAVYASQNFSGILDYIIASTAIPIEMPHVIIGTAPYVDGGVREVAPLKRAIEDGADEIACIACLPRKLDGVSFRPGNLMDFSLRLMDVITNELINNDIDRFQKVNSWVKIIKQMPRLETELASFGLESAAGLPAAEGVMALPFAEWREIPMILIRPENEIVLDLLHFTPEDINEVILQGRNIAQKVLDAEPAET